MQRAVLVMMMVLCGCRPAALPDGSWVKFGDTKDNGWGKLYLPPKPASPGVVVLHGDHGLSPRIEGHARRLRDTGFLVLAVDLYRGEKADNTLEAHILNRGLPDERVKHDLRGAVDFLRARTERVGIIGWDMGGGYALDAALDDPRLAAVVTCYGRLTTDPELLKSMNAAVLALMPAKDEGNGPETRTAFREAMAAAGKRLTLHVVEGCDYGFMTPAEGAKLDETEENANEAAWGKITQFFRTELASK